jgi:3-deoxy-D-manno-octulosonic-acid transferase
MIGPLLSRLQLCAVQSEEQAFFFQALGAKEVVVMGNAKLMMTSLSVDSKKYQVLKKEIGNRPLWVAASTHPGEEDIVFKVHKILKKQYANLLTILVPRHIERVSSLHQVALKEGIPAALQTQTSSLSGIEVYIGDTLGEMGLFYALSPVVVMGATFVPKGGHNPIEAAQLGAFVLHGPHTFNNAQLYGALESLGFSQSVQEEYQLSEALSSRINDPKESYEEPAALKAYREEGLKNLMTLLTPHLKGIREEWE